MLPLIMCVGSMVITPAYVTPTSYRTFQQQFGDAANAGIHEKINILRVKNRFANPVGCLAAELCD